MSEPFFRYCWAISACLAQITILCHSVRFWRSPFLSLKLSSVASEKLQTAWPAPVYRVSGSLPRRPTKITLLTDIWFLHLRKEDNTRVETVQIPRKKEAKFSSAFFVSSVLNAFRKLTQRTRREDTEGAENTRANFTF